MPPEPSELDGGHDAVKPVVVGTILWAVAFVVLLMFYGRLDDNDATWWLWVCATGFALGLPGIWYVRRRRETYKRERSE